MSSFRRPVRSATSKPFLSSSEVLNVLGALPQQWDVENWKVLVNLKIPTTGYDSKPKPTINKTPVSKRITAQINQELGIAA